MTETTHALRLQIALEDKDRNEVIALLQQHHLPVADIDSDKLLYGLMEDNKMIGTVGLEIFDDCALLRSVSIAKDKQGKGYGKFINEAIEKYVTESGINCLYLLTTTAKGFFEKQGYCVINREEAPLAIQQSAEFTSLCPSSAVLMKKRI